MYISSDTNIWLDFFEISQLSYPFMLGYKYYMSIDSFEDELVKSDKIKNELLNFGLNLVDMTNDEFLLAQDYQAKYRRLSSYDRFALSIAKKRSWILLTGDMPLRQAAKQEEIECHGVIWVYDELVSRKKITKEEFKNAMRLLHIAVQEGRCRLPLSELTARIDNS